MEDNLHNLRAQTSRIALTSEEKAAGRERLASFMSLTPRREKAPAAKAGAFASLRLPHFGRGATVFAASFIVMVSAGGISYAAESAVPGDALYAVKVGVNEEVRATLMRSEVARAEWEAERASRRMAEAETLASRGALKTETRVMLQEEFHKHAAVAEQHVANIREDEGEGLAVDLTARIEGTIRAHRQIIGALKDGRREKREARKAAEKNGGTAATKEQESDEDEQVTALEASVNVEADAAASKRGKTEAKNAVGKFAGVASFADGRRNAAVTKIAEVRTWLTAKGSGFTAESKAEAEARLTAADAFVAEGNAAKAAENYRAAFDAYAKAQRLAQEAKMTVRASKELKVRVRFDHDESRQRGDGDIPQPEVGRDSAQDDQDEDAVTDADPNVNVGIRNFRSRH